MEEDSSSIMKLARVGSFLVIGLGLFYGFVLVAVGLSILGTGRVAGSGSLLSEKDRRGAGVLALSLGIILWSMCVLLYWAVNRYDWVAVATVLLTTTITVSKMLR